MLKYDNQWKPNSCTVRLTNETLEYEKQWLEKLTGCAYGWQTLEYEKQRKTNRLNSTVDECWNLKNNEQQTGWRWLEYEKQWFEKTEKLHSTVYRRWNMKSKEVAHTADERWNMRNRLNSTVGGGWNINNEKQTGCTVRLTEVGIWATGWTVRLTAVGIWETITWKTNRLHSTVYGRWNMKNNKKTKQVKLRCMDVGIWETIKKQKQVKQYGVWTLEYEKQFKKTIKKKPRLNSTVYGRWNMRNKKTKTG